jgi:hypothetical protein
MPRKQTKPVAAPTPRTKARVELRFDSDLHRRLQKLAADLDVSLNQLLEAVTEWAVDNAVLGKPIIHPNGRVDVQPEPGSVFFGHPTPDAKSPLPGRVHFAIAFHRAWAIRSSSDFDTVKGLLPS